MSLINLLSSSNYLVVNKSLAEALGMETSIILSELISEYEYWKNRELLVDGEYFFSTIENIEKNTTYSRRKQDRAIKILKELNFIDTKLMGLPSKRYFRLNIEEIQNYLLYKMPEIDTNVERYKQQKVSELNNLQCASQTTNNNNININNNNNNINKKKKKETEIDSLINNYTDNPELIEMLYNFVKMRKSIKAPLTTRAMQLILNKLDKFSNYDDGARIVILENSIMFSWRGIFPLKEVDYERIGKDTPASEDKWSKYEFE